MIVRLRTLPQVSNLRHEVRTDRTGPKKDLCTCTMYNVQYYTIERGPLAAHARRLSVTKNSAKNASCFMKIAVAIYVLEER
jgi:hypothetical protein